MSKIWDLIIEVPLFLSVSTNVFLAVNALTDETGFTDGDAEISI